MAAASMLGFAVLLLIVVLPLSIGIVLILKARGKGLGYPACGSCKYDVSASVGTTDRCPECGLLFITAGILPPRGYRQPALMWMGIALVAMTLSCAGFALLASYRSQTAMQRARQAATIQQQTTQQLPQQQQLQQEQEQEATEQSSEPAGATPAEAPPPVSE